MVSTNGESGLERNSLAPQEEHRSEHANGECGAASILRSVNHGGGFRRRELLWVVLLSMDASRGIARAAALSVAANELRERAVRGRGSAPQKPWFPTTSPPVFNDLTKLKIHEFGSDNCGLPEGSSRAVSQVGHKRSPSRPPTTMSASRSMRCLAEYRRGSFPCLLTTYAGIVKVSGWGRRFDTVLSIQSQRAAGVK
jgi:hypothetical protein